MTLFKKRNAELGSAILAQQKIANLLLKSQVLRSFKKKDIKKFI
jgi:hypothetical protein